MPKRVFILGVPVDAVTMGETMTILGSLAGSGIGHHVMTPNPEMIVEAQRNPAFRALLATTSLNIPDGAGLLVAARLQGARLPERVTGTDLVEEIASSPALQPVFFLGAAEGIAGKAASVLAGRHPGLQVAGTYAGSPESGEEESIVAMINASGARTLLVAYGAPAQDLWIGRMLKKLPTVRIAIGVGGAFDFLAGLRTRAPLWMRNIGLEWLWRLVHEPSRLGRICTAVIVFPLLVLRDRFAPTRSRGGTRIA